MAINRTTTKEKEKLCSNIDSPVGLKNQENDKK
jgi:hypothetical protein